MQPTRSCAIRGVLPSTGGPLAARLRARSRASPAYVPSRSALSRIRNPTPSFTWNAPHLSIRNVTPDLAHLEPIDVAQRLIRAAQRVANRCVDALRRRSNQLDDLVRVRAVCHQPLLPVRHGDAISTKAVGSNDSPPGPPPLRHCSSRFPAGVLSQITGTTWKLLSADLSGEGAPAPLHSYHCRAGRCRAGRRVCNRSVPDGFDRPPAPRWERPVLRETLHDRRTPPRGPERPRCAAEPAPRKAARRRARPRRSLGPSGPRMRWRRGH